jgi:O-methyltransferase
MTANCLMQSRDDYRGARMAGAKQDDFEARIRRSIDAYHESALVYAAVKLGLPDKMGTRSWTAEQLAETLGLSAPHLLRFMRALASLGICEERRDGEFALSPAGRCLSADSPSRLAEKVQIVVEQYWRPWANLVSCLQTGTPAFEQVFGMSVRDWRRLNTEQGALFNSYLAKEAQAQADPIVDALDFSDVRTVADVGGGHGGLLTALLKAHPHVQGVLFDFPETIEAAKPYLQSLGVAERIELAGGDVLTGIPVRADLFVLKGVLQQYDDADSLAILKNCRAAVLEGTKLAIIERLLPERATDDPAAIMLDLHIAIMLDLHMMTITSGRARSVAAFEALLSEAGLKLSKATPTRSGLTIIEAVLK